MQHQKDILRRLKKLAKWKGYSLNLCNVTYFKKEENEFVETILEAFTLYLDRYKQKDGVSKCIDIVI